MHTWIIGWPDYGAYATTARNEVTPDQRPRTIVAKDYQYSIAEGSGQVISVFFTNEQDEAILTLFDLPTWIRRDDAQLSQ